MKEERELLPRRDFGFVVEKTGRNLSEIVFVWSSQELSENIFDEDLSQILFAENSCS